MCRPGICHAFVQYRMHTHPCSLSPGDQRPSKRRVFLLFPVRSISEKSARSRKQNGHTKLSCMDNTYSTLSFTAYYHIIPTEYRCMKKRAGRCQEQLFSWLFIFLTRNTRKQQNLTGSTSWVSKVTERAKTTGTLLLSGAKSQESREILGRTFFVNGLNNYCELKLLL